ncbi:MAG: hypothetical protein ACP5QG_01390 [candidate division WOR-3 bacterium]
MKVLMIRGFGITELAEFVRMRLGDKGKEIFVSAGVPVEPDKNKWYPVESLTPIMQAMGGKRQIYREFGRFTSRRIASTIKILSFVFNLPTYLIKNANIVWHYYFNQERWEIADSGKGFVVVDLLDSNMPGLWAEEVAGWIEGAFGLGGFERIEVTIIHESPERDNLQG